MYFFISFVVGCFLFFDTAVQEFADDKIVEDDDEKDVEVDDLLDDTGTPKLFSCPKTAIQNKLQLPISGLVPPSRSVCRGRRHGRPQSRREEGSLSFFRSFVRFCIFEIMTDEPANNYKTNNDQPTSD